MRARGDQIDDINPDLIESKLAIPQSWSGNGRSGGNWCMPDPKVIERVHEVENHSGGQLLIRAAEPGPVEMNSPPIWPCFGGNWDRRIAVVSRR